MVDNSNNQFEINLANFVQKNNPLVYIMTPCYGGVCFCSYFQSLVVTLDAFKRYGIEYVVEFCKNDSLITRARNNLIAKAMSNPKTTHMIFIDADITWNPVEILKLLLADKELVGGVYPLKKYHWDKLTKNNNFIAELLERKKNTPFTANMSDELFIQNNMVNYNLNYLNTSLDIQNNLAQVRHIATGFMMIKRSCIEKMQTAHASLKYIDDVGYLTAEESKYAYTLFDCGIEDTHYLSEDWMFCARWAKLGGEIFIDVTINLTHTGTEDFRGSYISSIKLG